MQNHGALIAGAFVDYRADIDVVQPLAQLQWNGQDIFSGIGANPAGDPRRLLHWLVHHFNAQGIALPGVTFNLV